MLEFVSCPATLALGANLVKKRKITLISNSNIELKVMTGTVVRSLMQESETSVKHSVRAGHTARDKTLSPSIVLPGHVCVRLVMDFSLVVMVGALKANCSLKVSWGGYKQPKILAIGLSFAQEMENVGAGAQKWIFSALGLYTTGAKGNFR